MKQRKHVSILDCEVGVRLFRQRVDVALLKRSGVQPREQDNEVGEQIIDWPLEGARTLIIETTKT